MSTLSDLDVHTTALVVIDMQRDFCSPGGYAHQAGIDISRMQAVVGQVQRLLKAARAAGPRVVHTREGHLPDLSDCPPAKLARSEQGHDFVDALRPVPGEEVIEKPGYGAFHQTRLDNLLARHGTRRLIVCGVTTEVCVHSTLREAVDRGFVCTTVGDATAASQPELQAPALAMIGVEGGIFGQVCSTDEAVAALTALTPVTPHS